MYIMNDKQILQRLLELGLQKLVEQSGQNLEDFIQGQGIKKAPVKHASAEDLPPTPTSFDEERMAKFAAQQADRQR